MAQEIKTIVKFEEKRKVWRFKKLREKKEERKNLQKFTENLRDNNIRRVLAAKIKCEAKSETHTVSSHKNKQIKQNKDDEGVSSIDKTTEN